MNLEGWNRNVQKGRQVLERGVHQGPGLWGGFLLAAAVLILGASLVKAWPLFLSYFTFPYEINPMEGNVLDMGLRVLQGRSPYPDPVREGAIAYMYPPLGSTLLGAAYLAGGKALVWARGLSVAAMLCVAAILAAYGGKRNALVGVTAALAWLACQPLMEWWTLFARVDSLAAAALIAALLEGERVLEGKGSLWVLVGLTVAAVFSKQQGMVALAAVGCALLLARAYRKALVFAFLSAGLCLFIGGFLHFWTDGWFSRTLLLGRAHPLKRDLLENALGFFLQPFFLFLLAGVLVTLKRTWRRPWFLAWMGMVPIGLLGASKLGGGVNSLIPLVALQVGLAARGAHALLEWRGRIWVRRIVLLLIPAGAAAIYWGGVRVKDIPPNAALAEATVRLVEQAGGPVLMERYQEYLLRCDRPVHDDLGAAFDFEMGGHPVCRRLAQDIFRQKFRLILAEPLRKMVAISLLQPEEKREPFLEIIKALGLSYKEDPSVEAIFTVYRPRQEKGALPAPRGDREGE